MYIKREKGPSKRKTFYNLPTNWQIFCETSSIRGLRNTYLAPTIFLRGVWFCFVMGMTVILCVTAVLHIRDYLSYETKWLTSTLLDHSTDFPAITLCQENPFSLQAKTLWKQGKIMSPRQFKDRLYNASRRLILKGLSHLGGSLPLYDKMEFYYANLDLQDTQALGHGREMLPFCMVSMKANSDQRLILADNCSLEDQTPLYLRSFSHSDYFNCWTVEGKPDQTTSKVQRITFIIQMTPSHKFSQLQGVFMMDLMSHGEGLKVVVHERGTYPDIRGNAINIQSGRLNEIIYEPVYWCRSERGETTCKDEQTGISDLDRVFQYTFPQCLESQVQKEFLEKCHCSLTELPGRHISPHGSPYCMRDLDDPAVLERVADCYNEVINQRKAIRQKAQGSVCFPRCSEFTFTTSLSVSDWTASIPDVQNLIERHHRLSELQRPNNSVLSAVDKYFALEGIASQLNEHIRDSLPSREAEEALSYAYVTVGRKNDDTTLQEETLMLDVSVLLSRIGGLSSICIGLTAAFFVEIIEFAWVSIYASMHRRYLQSLHAAAWGEKRRINQMNKVSS